MKPVASHQGWQLRDAPAVALAGVLVVYGLFMLFVGFSGTGVGPNGLYEFRGTSVAAVIPLIAGSLVGWGAWTARERLIWVGAAVALLFSIAFVFSIGGLVLPIAMLLVVAVAIRHRGLGRR